MEFRNSYPAFSGQFVIKDAPDDQLELAWNLAPHHATAHIDLRTYATEITFYDDMRRKNVTFRV